VREPAVFLFDEPLSNLDAKLRVQMRAEIARLHRRLGARRLRHPRPGRGDDDGRSDRHHERGAAPAGRHAARGLRHARQPVRRQLHRHSSNELRAGTFEVALPARLAAAARPHAGKTLTAGIRPENVRAVRDEARGASAEIEAVVEIVEPLGHEAIVYARAGEDPFITAVDPHVMPRQGEKIPLHLELERIHLFDPENEKRLEV
jgi:multiple sugar transport system ATP-binding protein